MDLQGALKMLERERLVPLTAVPGFTSLVEAIAGGPVKGSWWGHPAGQKIFEVASAIEDRADVLVAKLLGGKVTFIHGSLHAPFFRIVCDRAWRRAARERGGDPGKSLLVYARSVHTDSGHHRTVQEPWSSWAAPSVVKA